MSISPFSARPAPSDGDRSGIAQQRSRLALLIAMIGIGATILAYAISPGVRHAVSHATHSVKHAVGNVLDHDVTKRAHPTAPAQTVHPKSPVRAPAGSRTTGSHVSGGSTVTPQQTSTSTR